MNPGDPYALARGGKWYQAQRRLKRAQRRAWLLKQPDILAPRRPVREYAAVWRVHPRTIHADLTWIFREWLPEQDARRERLRAGGLASTAKRAAARAAKQEGARQSTVTDASTSGSGTPSAGWTSWPGAGQQGGQPGAVSQVGAGVQGATPEGVAPSPDEVDLRRLLIDARASSPGGCALAGRVAGWTVEPSAPWG